MSAEKLKSLRSAAGLSQRYFSQEMGLPLRTYENLENGQSEVRDVHLNAARWALVKMIAGDEFGLVTIPDDISDVVRKAAEHL